MNITKEQQRLIDSVALEFGNFEAFNFRKEWVKSENKAHMQSKLRDFLIHEVIVRVEKSYFELRCSVGAMAFLETLYCYSRIKMGVGKLTLASCDIILEIDFDLAGSTIMYHVLDPRSEQTLTRVLIAE